MNYNFLYGNYSMRILSWNILADEFIKKRYYPMISPEILLNRRQREKQILLTLTHSDMDVMLLQEVMQAEYNALVQAFQKTHNLIRGKNIKWQGKSSHSGNVILLRKTLFQVNEQIGLAFGIPLAFGVAVHCLYKHRPLLILNLHLDDLSKEKRLHQWKEVQPYFSGNEQVIVGGDFNENREEMSELYQAIKATGLKTLNRKPSYYIEKKMCIDNILIKGLALKHSAAQVVNDFGADVPKQFITYGSDHLPVIVD